MAGRFNAQLGHMKWLLQVLPYIICTRFHFIANVRLCMQIFKATQGLRSVPGPVAAKSELGPYLS